MIMVGVQSSNIWWHHQKSVNQIIPPATVSRAVFYDYKYVLTCAYDRYKYLREFLSCSDGSSVRGGFARVGKGGAIYNLARARSAPRDIPPTRHARNVHVIRSASVSDAARVAAEPAAGFVPGFDPAVYDARPRQNVNLILICRVQGAQQRQRQRQLRRHACTGGDLVG